MMQCSASPSILLVLQRPEIQRTNMQTMPVPQEHKFMLDAFSKLHELLCARPVMDVNMVCDAEPDAVFKVTEINWVQAVWDVM